MVSANKFLGHFIDVQIAETDWPQLDRQAIRTYFQTYLSLTVQGSGSKNMFKLDNSVFMERSIPLLQSSDDCLSQVAC
jgi:hypothetical protein